MSKRFFSRLCGIRPECVETVRFFSHTHPIAISVVLFCLILPVGGRSLSAADSNLNTDLQVKGRQIEIFVRHTDKKIRIDGVLDDVAWNEAQVWEDYFYQREPLDRQPSSEKTRVMVLQNDEVLYFGIQNYYADPDKIFATAMRRDTNFGGDDVIELLLDTFQDNRNCYSFDTNPLGGKGDAIIRDQGNHINKQWECVIEMDGAVNAQGWAAEFAVPFRSIKYGTGEVVDWGFNISREIRHNQEETYLVPIPRALGHMGKFRGELWGTLKNIRPPGKGLNLEISPYLLGGRTILYDNQTREAENEFNSGIDLKYDFTPQLALDLTYKTDFAQVEAEEEIVNVTRFNVRREEKRGFFLQNAGLFQFGTGRRSQSNFMLFDSRTIGTFDRQRIPLAGGGKLTGRAGKYSIAALNMQSESTVLEDKSRHASTNYTAVRIKRDVAENSHIGIMFLNQQSNARDFSRAFGMDGLWNVTEAIRFDASMAGSFEPNQTTENLAGDMGFTLNKEWIDIQLRHTQIDSAFNPKMGFVRRNNMRNTDGDLTFTKWVNGRLVQNYAFSTGLSYITDQNHVLQTRDISGAFSFLSRSGDVLEYGVIRSYEFVPEMSSIRDLTISSGIYESWMQTISLRSYRSRSVNLRASMVWGQLFDGNSRSFALSGAAKVSNHLSGDLSYTYNDLDLKSGKLLSHVTATRWIFAFTPDLFAKAYLQWNTADERFSMNFLLDYAYRPKSHLYLVYNENQDTQSSRPKDRILMLKLTYLWQI